MVQFYENRFKADSSLSSDFSLLDEFEWKTVSTDQNSMLTAVPSLAKTREAVFSLDLSHELGYYLF